MVNFANSAEVEVRPMHGGSEIGDGPLARSDATASLLQQEVLQLREEFTRLTEENTRLTEELQGAKTDLQAAEANYRQNEFNEARFILSPPISEPGSMHAAEFAEDHDNPEQIEDEYIDAVMKVESQRSIKSAASRRSAHHDYHMDVNVMQGSAISKSRAVQCVIYLLAFAGLVFVLVAKAMKWGGETHVHPSDGDDLHDSHRRLNAVMPSLLMTDMMYSVAAAGLLSFLVNLIKQPLILGYLLGGVLLGPIGLNIVPDHQEMSQLSSLGLIFLLFMIGLELDVSELFKMGKVVICTGLLQFPVCAATHFAIFTGLEAMGVSFGNGPNATLYVGVTCGISSTMIVVKLLSEKAEMDSAQGRLTVGILIFQDIWAIIILAIQPKLDQIEVVGLVKTFAMIFVLIVVALAYAKFVIPAVLVKASASVELMLIIALAWCFFMGALATLPFIGQSAELAALIAGVALATFPYSAEFNGKIKYIRDFFITLFFVGLGMQIPVPSFAAIAKALLVALVVLLVRWLGIFLIVWLLGGGRRLAGMSTINLSEISEFALVICSLGMNYDHVEQDTLTILIWTFSLLAILASYMIGNNYALYGFIGRTINRCMGRRHQRPDGSGEDNSDDHPDRDILLLGFNKIAAMLVMEIEHHGPHLLEKLHVVAARNLNQISPELEKRKVTFSYGDIGLADVLEHAFHGSPRLVISSIPDSMLRAGLTNLRILQVAKQVWPSAHVIVSADNPAQAIQLYAAGADYVLRTAKLCAERLNDLITEHTGQLVHRSHPDDDMVEQLFHNFRHKERDHHREYIHTG